MSDIPKDLRSQLQDQVEFISVSAQNLIEDKHTKKALLKLSDDHSIETVLMDYDQWLTACLSTQVGCPIGCTFCATGKMGFIRNLSVDEIVDQIVYWNQLLYPKYIGRIVFMGMGEPFANWDNLISSLEIINHKNALDIGARKISISTSGIISAIDKFTQMNSNINLAISLHSANQVTRAKLMPIALTNPLDKLLESAKKYVNHTHRQLFFEYALISQVNDTPEEINQLIKFIKQHHLFYLNLIPLNQTSSNLSSSSTDRISQICQLLDKNHVQYSLRRNFGSSISAACGQLATKNTKL